MNKRVGAYSLEKVCSKSKSGSYVSYLAKRDDTEQSYILTEYSLSLLLNSNDNLVAERLLFIKQNFHLFHCREIFFDVDLKSNAQIKVTNIPNFISKLYVVEYAVLSLVDHWYESGLIPSRLFTDIGFTLQELHRHDFCYGFLSPFMIVLDSGKWKLRVPPVNPLIEPKDGIAPPFACSRANFRTPEEIRFYFPPERRSVDISTQWDSWAFGVLIYNFTVLKGAEVFASVSWKDQIRMMRKFSENVPVEIAGFFSVDPKQRQTVEEWIGKCI